MSTIELLRFIIHKMKHFKNTSHFLKIKVHERHPVKFEFQMLKKKQPNVKQFERCNEANYMAQN